MLRAVRFAAQLGFEIEPKTFAAIQALAPKIKSSAPSACGRNSSKSVSRQCRSARSPAFD
jgi:tRNA nucleotidyltransferase/poly(A) polymerase